VLLYFTRYFPGILFEAVREIARCIISFTMTINASFVQLCCKVRGQSSALQKTRVSKIGDVLITIQWHKNSSAMSEVNNGNEWEETM